MEERGSHGKPFQWRVLCAVTIAIGLALRLAVLRSPAGRLDSDESVVALMADVVARGHRPALFFWGQYYGGTIEQLMVALAFKVHRSATTLKAVPLLLSAASAWCLSRAARPIVGRERARLAGALLFAWPGTTWLATKERGFYWVGMFLVCSALAFATHLVARRATRPNLVWWCYGLTIGVAWYTSSQTMFVLVPLTIWVASAVRPTIRSIGWTGVGALIGMSPWLRGLQLYRTKVFHQDPALESYLTRLHHVTFELVPRVLGLRTLFVGGWTFAIFGVVLYLVVVLALAMFALRRWRHPVAVDRNSSRLIVVLAASFPFLAAIPNLAVFVSEPRYGLYLVPTLALFLVVSVHRFAAAAAVVVVVLAVGIASTTKLVDMANRTPQPLLDLTPSDTSPIEHALHERGVTRVYADYWLANPLTFRHRYGIIASPIDQPRALWAMQAVDAAHSTTWVVYQHSARDEALPAALTARGINVTRHTIGEFAIFSLDRYLNPLALGSFWAHHHAGH